jgi:hypothetical protein
VEIPQLSGYSGGKEMLGSLLIGLGATLNHALVFLGGLVAGLL